MTKARDALNWLKSALGVEGTLDRSTHPKSIMERLEGLIPPVELIQKSYKVDTEVAEAGHQIMLAAEKLMVATLKKQQKAIEASELLLDQQEATAGIIDTQVNKQFNAETIIQNFKIFLTEDELTIQWILEHIIKPSLFSGAFGKLEEGKQRELFNALRTTVNKLQKKDGMLAEPRHDASGQAAPGGA